MGLLDQVIGSLVGNGSGSGSPLQGILQSVLSGGNGQEQGQSQGQAMGQGQGFGNGQGLAGLVSTLEQAGLGHLVQSWIGDGANQPVSPQQLHEALGSDQVQQMASQSGMAPQDLLSQLSQHLPELINRLTPNGQLPR